MRRPLHISLLIVFSIAASMMIGCSSVKAPRFETLGVREVEQTDTRAVYAFKVKAINPNKEPIPLSEVSYSVTLDGDYVFTGVRSPETTLHTYGEHIFELPAVFEIAPQLRTGTMDYRLSGSTKYIKPGKLAEVMFESKISVPKAAFNLRGQVNFDE
jgi:hypothetical protein